jgi:hypothetical protein
MAIYTFEVPDEFSTTLGDAFAAAYGWPETVTNEQGEQVPNPETKLTFARRKVVEFVKEICRAHGEKQIDLAVESQKAAARAAIEAVSIELRSE